MKQKKAYSLNADIIRIIAGIAVVLIHASDPFLIYPPYYGVGGLPFLILSFLNIASRISVPLFILLSGYLLLRKAERINTLSFYKRRLRKIGIPFVFWLIVYFVTLRIQGVKLSAWFIINSIFSVNIGVLYFLVIIFELYFITPYLNYLLKKMSKRGITLYVLSILITIGINLFNHYLPNLSIITTNIFTIFISYISYYLGGYYLGKTNISSTMKVFILFFYWISLLFTFFSNNNTAISAVNTAGLQFNNVNILVMSSLIFIFLINNSIITRRFSSFLTFIKLLSHSIFGIYLIHPYVFLIIDRFNNLQPGNIQMSMLVIVVIKTIVAFGISLLLVNILKLIPFAKKVLGF